jgi:hypothetical protein
MSIVHTKTERNFNPHLLLLRGAEYHLNSAKEKKGGWYYDWLGAIVLSALCLEAIGNSYGKVLIRDWKERIAVFLKDGKGASPMRKLQLVAENRGINPDFTSHPWLTAKKLADFRNLIAHARREPLIQEDDCRESDYGWMFSATLKSNVEELITEEFATQSHDAVQQIISAFNYTLERKELYELTYDGNVCSAQISTPKVA